MTAPKYKIGNFVYLAEAARNGNLESFEVLSIRQEHSGVWYYLIGVPQRPPVGATMGDRNTGKYSYHFEIAEADALTICEAVNIAEAFYVSALTKIRAIKTSYCS